MPGIEQSFLEGQFPLTQVSNTAHLLFLPVVCTVRVELKGEV